MSTIRHIHGRLWFLNQLHSGALARIEINGERNTLVLDEIRRNFVLYYMKMPGKRKHHYIDVNFNKRVIFEWLGQMWSTGEIDHEWTPHDEVHNDAEKPLSTRSEPESWSSAKCQVEQCNYMQTTGENFADNPPRIRGLGLRRDADDGQTGSTQIPMGVADDLKDSTADSIPPAPICAQDEVGGSENPSARSSTFVFVGTPEVAMTTAGNQNSDSVDDARSDTSHDSVKTYKASSKCEEKNVPENNGNSGYERLGNLHPILQAQPHPVVVLDSCDIRRIVDITLCESICGWTRTIETVDRQSISVSPSGPTGPDWTKVYPGLGRPKLENPDKRGALIVDVRICYPMELTVHQKRVLCGVL